MTVKYSSNLFQETLSLVFKRLTLL